MHDRFRSIRQASLDFVAGLTAEDCAAQSMPDCSPLKWHLAHTTWFFETFVLRQRSELGSLFNSYYRGVGEPFARHKRGLLTRPDLDAVLRYRHDIDQRVGALAEPSFALELGLHHEQQHQELMRTDFKHLLFENPLHRASPPLPRAVPELRWLRYDAALATIGAEASGFAFDNERPAHRVWVDPFQLASRLVTAGEYQRFIADRGYERAELWLDEGFEWLRRERITAPLYWNAEREDSAPLCHVSYYEADAFARWAQARLPTEAEWEVAARSAQPPSELFDRVWQWTLSAYAPYPGFAPFSGELGEYNGKFMVNQYVLRGGSAFTPPGHSRPSYRNFFAAGARWQMSGIRLAKEG